MSTELERAPLISVIIPVYNTAQYLREALDSILAQTYTHWEMLLIDDGSTDGSGEICDEYAAEDARIRVWHTPQSGVSHARNIGLDHAKGEWVYFLDSDDWIEPNALEIMIKYSDNMDVVMGCFPIKCPFPFKEAQNVKTYNLCGIDIQELEELGQLSFTTTVWDKLYCRRSLTVRFDEEMINWEDNCFNLSQFCNWKHVIVLPHRLYHYRRHSCSSLSWRLDINRIIMQRKYFKLYQEVFGKCHGLMNFRSMEYVYELCRCLLSMGIQIRNRSRRLFLIGLWLNDEQFDHAQINTTLLDPGLQRFWALVLNKDAEGICKLIDGQMPQSMNEGDR